MIEGHGCGAASVHCSLGSGATVSLQLRRPALKVRLLKLGHDQLVAVVSVITPNDPTQLDATDSEMFRILRLTEKPTKSVVVQLSRIVRKITQCDHPYNPTQLDSTKPFSLVGSFGVIVPLRSDPTQLDPTGQSGWV